LGLGFVGGWVAWLDRVGRYSHACIGARASNGDGKHHRGILHPILVTTNLKLPSTTSTSCTTVSGERATATARVRDDVVCLHGPINDLLLKAGRFAETPRDEALLLLSSPATSFRLCLACTPLHTTTQVPTQLTPDLRANPTQPRKESPELT
jgi:hypothetical protein